MPLQYLLHTAFDLIDSVCNIDDAVFIVIGTGKFVSAERPGFCDMIGDAPGSDDPVRSGPLGLLCMADKAVLDGVGAALYA